MEPEDLSKNREATGIRVDPLVSWRQQQTTLWQCLDAVEYRRLPSQQAPYFSVNGFIRLLPIKTATSISQAEAIRQHRVLLDNDKIRLDFYRQQLALWFPTVPVYAISYLAPSPMKKFVVTNLRTNTLAVLSAQTYSQWIGHEHDWQEQGDRAYATYSQWHRTVLAHSAYFHDIDLVEKPYNAPRWIEVTRADQRALDYTVFAFLIRSFAQVGIYRQLAASSGGSARLVVHDVARQIVQCDLSRTSSSLMSWIDRLTRERQTLVRQAPGTYHQRMGHAARQLFDRHAQDAPFTELWAHRQQSSSYESWYQSLSQECKSRHGEPQR